VQSWQNRYMTISTNKTGENVSTPIGGAIADALTVVRVCLTPVIMFIIIKGWPDLSMAILATGLLIIAAVTDFFDDYFGGTENAPNRKFGWFDDIADIVLVTGVLIALLVVTYKGGVLGWMFAVSIKNGLTMLGTCLLVASPWITHWVDMTFSSKDNIESLTSTSPQIWMIGQGVLWFAALISLITGFKILTTKTGPANDA